MNYSHIIQRIWNLCNILRDDGISYHQYVAELTYLLFLKFSDDNKAQKTLPVGCSWHDLLNGPKETVLGRYQDMLTTLGKSADEEMIREIFAFPTTVFSHSENLTAVLEGISEISWSDVEKDSLGEIYEGLIERSSQDVRSGAGQYFTPRPLIQCMVNATKPKFGEVIQDPASGSGGFFTSAHNYLCERDGGRGLKKIGVIFQGMEIEKNTRRICLMNCYLNEVNICVVLGDALTNDADTLEPADLILANPPFGTRVSGHRKLREELATKGASKQLLFLQHIYKNLRNGGRAAVVVPDNVLFESGLGKSVRRELMHYCDLHTVLRLPTGIFYSAGVKTNVLFFVKGENLQRESKGIWFYDLRSGMPNFGRSRPLTDQTFDDFLSCFGDDPYGASERLDTGTDGRFRCFSMDEIEQRSFNLDISWMDDEVGHEHVFQSPEDIASSIFAHLQGAMEEMEVFTELLVGAEETTRADE